MKHHLGDSAGRQASSETFAVQFAEDDNMNYRMRFWGKKGLILSGVEMRKSFCSYIGEVFAYGSIFLP